MEAGSASSDAVHSGGRQAGDRSLALVFVACVLVLYAAIGVGVYLLATGPIDHVLAGAGL